MGPFIKRKGHRKKQGDMCNYFEGRAAVYISSRITKSSKGQRAEASGQGALAGCNGHEASGDAF
jgi:hypothetical protein